MIVPRGLSRQVLVLDFDGVILESAGVKDAAYYDLFADIDDFARHAVMRYHREHPGIERSVKIRELCRRVLQTEVDECRVESLRQRYGSIVWDKLLACELVPGITEFFAAPLPISSTYVVSAAPRQEVVDLCRLHKLDQYFVGIYGSPDKKADALRNILDKERVATSDVLYIGDRKADLDAARIVGVKFLARWSPATMSGEFPSGQLGIDHFGSENWPLIINSLRRS